MLGVTVGVTIKDSDWEQRRRHLAADNVPSFDVGSVSEVRSVCERSFSHPRMTCAYTLSFKKYISAIKEKVGRM